MAAINEMSDARRMNAMQSRIAVLIKQRDEARANISNLQDDHRRAKAYEDTFYEIKEIVDGALSQDPGEE